LTEPTAVTTITSQDIELSGLTNVADILRTVPSFGVSALTSSNSNFLTTASGINTLLLRNLEDDRTLVLVNGRLYVSGVSGSAAVDFNTIPVELVDRVEIIIGGASAIYGSDALAGVINIILKSDFEGVQSGYQYGKATKGGDQRQRAYLSLGAPFAQDRGNGVASISYTKDDGVFARERSNTEVDDIALCFLTDDPADCQTSFTPFFSSFSEGGRFFVPSTGQSFGIASGTGADAEVAPWSTNQFGFNRQAFRRYSIPTERFLLSTLLNYDLSSNVEAFVETTFAQTRTESELEPFPHSNSDLNIGGISVDNPFVPQAIRDAVLAAGDTEIEYFRRTTEVGQRGASAVRDTFRFVAGLKGEIPDNWHWESYFAYGRVDDAQQGTGQINVASMRNALDATDGDGDPNTFDPICADAAARAEGCVPINIFGFGSISPDAADYVRAPSSRQQVTQQKLVGATLGGSLAELWAGPLQVAGGVEYREELSKDVPDVLTQAGLNAGNAEAPTFGSYDVTELFAEFELPLVTDAPFVKELSVGGAYRYSDYSTVGDTDAYTGRFAWTPVESLRFRGQYARAVRAPNIGELFSPGGENFAAVADPCNNVTATSPGQVAENCRSIPAVAQRIADQGAFVLTQPEIQGTGGFTSKGNPNLSPEKADTWSLGVIFNRNLEKLGSVTLSVDYFNIEIDQFIDTVGRQTSVTSCFDAPASEFPNAFCDFVVRDTDGPAFQLGEITEVNSGFVNEGKLETEGLDVSLVWGWAFSDWVEAIPGQGSLRVNYTHLIDYTLTKFDTPADSVGEVGFAEDKAQLGFVYSIGDFSAQWEWNYISSSSPDVGDEFFGFKTGDYQTHDLQVSYALSGGGFLGAVRIYAGVNNLFDEKAPNILSGVPGNTTGTDTNASVYDPIGPTWYAGLTINY